MASRVEVYVDGDVVDDTFYTGQYVRLISSGSSVSYDRSADARTTGTINFIGSNWYAEEILNPLNNAELRPYIGARLSSGEWEWIPLGVLGVTDLSSSKAGMMTEYQCTCVDRSERVSTNTWQAPFQVAANLSYFDAVRNIITNRQIGFAAEYNLPAATAVVTPAMLFSEGDDPWQAARKAAEAESSELFFDRYGVVKALRLVDPLTEMATWSLGSSQYNIVLGPTSREVSRREVYTGVIVRSEAPWLLFPVIGTAWDDDPLSRTYRYGPLGERPMKIGDSLATSVAQCQSIAQAQLNKIKGIPETVNFGTLRDPRVEVGDTIELFDDTLRATGLYVLEQLQIEIGTGRMTGVLRRRK